MVDRFLLWLGAGAVCAGVTVGMLAGAGTAVAQTEPDGDGGVKTSQTTKPAENKSDSGIDSARRNQRHKRNFVSDTKPAAAADDHDAKVDADVDKNDTPEQSGKKPNRPEPGERTAKLIDNVVSAVTHKPDRKVVFDKTRQTERVEAPDPVETDPIHPEAVQTESTSISRVDRQVGHMNVVGQLTGFVPTRSNLELATPLPAQPKITAAASPHIDVPPVVSAIGTAVFGLISFAESVFEGPPLALPGSGVTVERSTLDLGDGHVVPADWYFPDTYDPESETPPKRIIYLQHGFGARGVFYDYTASYLAHQTNSIVVAPTVTSNLFATDGMWLGGDPMHRAMADLFLDSNPSLLDSARAAGYNQNQLPQEVVLVGHSLGGGAVLNMARYMAADERSTTPSSSYQLAGVLMLDGVSFTDPAQHIALIPDGPDGIPVYNLSSTRNPWNLFGTMDAALAQERPTEFHGAQMLFGWHSDAMVGGNPLIALAAYAITGYGGPANVEGTQVLAASWINDMFAGERTCSDTSCFYGATGSSFAIPTSFGPAIGRVAPKADPINSLLSELTLAVFRLTSVINFATDVPQTSAPLTAATTTTPPTLINVIGTAAWNVLDFASTILAGPPSVPADSSVTVGRSELAIDGYSAEADWYYPKSGTPDKFIYFQHGFPARAGFYNLTAAELAERNNAIVVAPSITGNIFAADGYSLGADRMHEAVAGLFEGDREALKASALAAGYKGDLPEKFVIAGHSGGGQLAAGAAGYYYRSLASGEESDLVGVLLYDTSATGGALERALVDLPPELPVLHIAAEPSAWDTFGNASDVLVAKRPNQFNGVQLIGGTHSDAFRSSTLFGLLQPLVALVTGASTPENVEAVQLLSQGWITDMYAGTVYTNNPSTAQQGIYGTPGSVIDIPGTAARAYVLPGPPVVLSPLDRVILMLLSSIDANQFAACASGSVASTPSCSPAIAA